MKVFRIFDRRPRRHASPILSIGCAAVIAIALLGPGPTAFAGEFAVYTTTGGTAVPGGSLTTSVILENLLDVSQGWSYSVCHDPTVLALTDADIGADGMMVNGGAPPDFVELQQYDSGWTVGVVINLIGAHVLGLGTFEIGRGYYEGVGVGTTTLCPCILGSPPVSTVVVYSGASLVPTLVCGTVEVVEGPYLIRGDANFDGAIDLGDGIRILSSLFLANMPLPCHDAGDANGDNVVNIADAVRVLNFLFAEGQAPVVPFPDCGAVPQANCAAGTVCP